MGCRSNTRLALLVVGAALLSSSSAVADGDREVRFAFRPVGRAQLALWVEDAAGTRFRTIALTRAVASRGIGNRPGASQMNSGFKWPYGRREGVLPVWAHRRADVVGSRFPLVIFNGRESEGLASVSIGEPRNSQDDVFCLSFDRSVSSRDALDAMTCPSVFNSNKGRYMTPGDVAGGYAEPFEDTPGAGRMRPLPLESLYPARDDVLPCGDSTCQDSPDVASFAVDAMRAMPEIDVVTRATFDGDRDVEELFTVPEDWPDGDYLAWLEINVEGDYNEHWGPERFPTPINPTGKWDSWAMTYGYPFRGQPSIVYRMELTLSAAGVELGEAVPFGYGSIDGSTGDITPIDGTITDDPMGAPGSGADRLRRLGDGNRLRVTVVPTNVCGQPEPPPACSMSCGPAAPCPEGFICPESGTCVGLCDIEMPPGAVEDLTLARHPDIEHAHEFALMSFTVPEAPRALSRYEVRVSTRPIAADDYEAFTTAAPANAATIDSVELVVPVDAPPGSRVDLEIGGLLPELTHWVAVRPIDECNDSGPIAVGSVTTAEIHFTTVSPCFVATAAWGTPMAEEISALRRFRDRHLQTTAPGRALVDLYYEVGPTLAEAIADRPWARAVVRAGLGPVTALVRSMP